jgi:hypothetical protein
MSLYTVCFGFVGKIGSCCWVSHVMCKAKCPVLIWSICYQKDCQSVRDPMFVTPYRIRVLA